MFLKLLHPCCRNNLWGTMEKADWKIVVDLIANAKLCPTGLAPNNKLEIFLGQLHQPDSILSDGAHQKAMNIGPNNQEQRMSLYLEQLKV
ncbi:hypothetical protein V6N13_071546 [Hibiscus sabdariffa]